MSGTGTIVVVSGQIGWDREGVLPDGLVAQTRRVLDNILAVLAEANAGPEHIVRLTWYVTNILDYRANAKELGAMWREVMGRNFPAMAVIGVACLVDEKACVEIETTAIIP